MPLALPHEKKEMLQMSRVDVLKKKFQADGLDAVMISNATNIKYMSGFTGEAGVVTLIYTNDKMYLLTDYRFLTQVKEECPDYEIIRWTPGTSLMSHSAKLMAELGLKKVGVEVDDLTHGSFMVLEENAPGVELVPCYPYIEEMRRVKTPEEIEKIKKACAISDASFISLLGKIKPGMTEIDIQNKLEFEFRDRGSEGASFPIIVASGPVNGSKCHGIPSDRKIEKGDLITIDFGAYWQGYCSDLTRTIAVGQPDPKLVEIYKIVLEAKKSAVATLKAGQPLRVIDRAARDVIEAHGYVLEHGLGHGFGYDIHEIPFIGARDYQMEAGVVHTVEPGIYVPNLGGVRIEDDYLITETGAEVLTHAPEDELIIL